MANTLKMSDCLHHITAVNGIHLPFNAVYQANVFMKNAVYCWTSQGTIANTGPTSSQDTSHLSTQGQLLVMGHITHGLSHHRPLGVVTVHL